MTPELAGLYADQWYSKHSLAAEVILLTASMACISAFAIFLPSSKVVELYS